MRADVLAHPGHPEVVRQTAGDGRWRRAYAVAALTLIAVYPFLPGVGRRIDFLVVSLSAIPPVFFTARRIALADRLPWLLLLAALVVVNVGSIARLLPGDFAFVASRLLDAAGNVLVLAAALAVVRRQVPDCLGGIIDTTIVALALGGLLWDVVLLPRLVDEFRGGAAQVELFVVVFALSGVVGALGRLVQLGKSPVSALWLLITALAFAVAGNAVLSMTTTQWLRVAAMMMFMAAYASIGLFGFDRTAVRLVHPEPMPRDDQLSVGRLVFLGAAVAVIPIVVGGRALLGADADGVLLVAGGVIVTALVMVRIGVLSSQRAHAETALKHEAAHDPLTGLRNRREFVGRLADALARNATCIVMFCDLDGFKSVNDRLGHAAGDQLLVRVAQRLRACVREGDMVSRFGGDEFLILFLDTPLEVVEQIGGRIDNALSYPVELNGKRVRVTASIGIAVADGEVDPEDLIRKADNAMYSAKRGEAQIAERPSGPDDRP